MYCELYRCKGRVINGRIYMYIGSHLISETTFLIYKKYCVLLFTIMLLATQLKLLWAYLQMPQSSQHAHRSVRHGRGPT